MIVLDTSVLSTVYRRHTRRTSMSRPALRFMELVKRDAPMAIPGVVLQEILSGVKTELQFRRLNDLLSGFPLLLADRETHVRAAEIRNVCRARGLAVATIDWLIASQALQADAELMTLDADFARIARHTPLKLLEL